MTFPFITCTTAGILLILQILLAIAVTVGRGQFKISLGDNGHAILNRQVRRHANLAENAGLFISGFLLLELSHTYPKLLAWLCLIFVIVRILHAIGLSKENTQNIFRILGGAGTYIIGLILGAALLLVGVPMLTA